MTTSIKTCFKCDTEKPVTEFYRHKEMADGHLNKCKPCARTDSTRTRESRIDYYRDYDKHRAAQPHRVAARYQYQQTVAGKASANTAKKLWCERNPIKRQASSMVSAAIKSGSIIKPSSCEGCGIEAEKIHGHHDDYSRPLDVRWFCPKCHSGWHKVNGPGLIKEQPP